MTEVEMNQEKIGSLIKDIRKKNNLTQREFADRYGVTYQAVSKWENGKNIPDIVLLRKICKDFNIDIESFLDGENIKNKKRNNRIMVIVLLILCIIISVILLIHNKNDDFEFKTISANCNNFVISGSIAYSNSKSSIYISNINYCGGEDNTKYDMIECVLYEETKKDKIEISSYSYDKNEKITLEDFLKDVTFVIDNYDKVCRDYSNNTLILVIKAKLDNKTVNYEIPLSIDNACGK